MFGELKKNILALWADLDARRRRLLVVSAGLMAALVVALSVWTLHTDYQVLFSDLEERDAATIVQGLKDMKVPYELGDGGKILVPAGQVHETRLRLMGKGVALSGGVGFEIFDNKDLGMTEYTQKVNYQRALQGELARTVMAVDQVKLARVHLVLPDASLFKREKSAPKGSVSLVLKPGGQLRNEQILGIQRLVAAAVPGLEPTMVTIVDQRGITLSALNDGDDANASVAGKLRVKRDVEEYLTRKIASVMDRTFGPGQAIVSVDVTVNFDDIRLTEESVIPASGNGTEATGVIVRKRQTTHRQGSDGAAKSGGPTDGNTVSTSNVNATNEIEYEVSKRVQQVVTAPGGVKRVSVGVLVPQPLSDERLARVRGVVSMVAGLSEARGDAIVVHSIDQLLQSSDATGAAPPPPVAAAATAIAPIAVAPWWYGVVAGLLMIGALLIYVLRRRWARDTDGRLTRAEREALLGDMRQWIAADQTAATAGAKP